MVDNVIPIEDPANYTRAHQRIKKLWNEGEVEFVIHAKGRMSERALDVTDIQHLIKYGGIVDHSKPGNLWRYVIEGRTIDGTRGRVVVGINGSLVVVTAYRL
jgi:hypothetical protein